MFLHSAEDTPAADVPGHGAIYSSRIRVQKSDELPHANETSRSI